jgi:DNA-binding NarL/FixJ family response regulator
MSLPEENITLKKQVKFLLFEDNADLREGLKEMLECEKEFKVMGQFSNCDNVVAATRRYKPDIALMDIDMPGTNGLDGLRAIKSENPEIKVLMLTVFDDNDKILSAICLGADGYLLKSTPLEKIIEAVKDVLHGGAPLTPTIAKKILHIIPKTTLSVKEEEELSPKEKEILQLMVQGYSYKMIAGTLNKSIETVRYQIKAIYRKLQVGSMSEAIIKTINKRIL